MMMCSFVLHALHQVSAHIGCADLLLSLLPSFALWRTNTLHHFSCAMLLNSTVLIVKTNLRSNAVKAAGSPDIKMKHNDSDLTPEVLRNVMYEWNLNYLSV
jgi:hypothetical protein